MALCARLLSVALLLPLVGCAADDPGDPPVDPIHRIDLRRATGLADPVAVGVTVTRDSARRVLLDESAGIFELHADGSASMLMPMAELPDPGIDIRPPFTDLVALGEDEFALSAIGDGFLLDLAEPSMRLHFCYEPGFFPEEWEQRTDALTYDPGTGRIYAQPRTFEADSGQVVASLIGGYDRTTGVDVEWYDLGSTDFVAGGMVVVPEAGMILGAGSVLFRFDTAAVELRRARDLESLGVQSITGLAVDHERGTLLVLDGESAELLEIEIAALEL